MENILWTETQVELLGRCVTYGTWWEWNSLGLIAAAGPGGLALLNKFCFILKDYAPMPVRDLTLKHTWVLQYDSPPKHASRSTSRWMKKKKRKLNVIEMTLKRVSNFADKTAKTSPQCRRRLVSIYNRCLTAVVVNPVVRLRGCSPSHKGHVGLAIMSPNNRHRQIKNTFFIHMFS